MRYPACGQCLPVPLGLLLVLLLPAAAAAAAEKATPQPRQGQIERIDAAVAAAAEFLVSRQGQDGAWRSGVHGSFRDGPSLTSHVLTTLYYLPADLAEAEAAFQRGVAYLLSIRPVDALLHFPVYTAAAMSWVVVLDDCSPQRRAVQVAWLQYLRDRQLNARLGWDPVDEPFGGWGYSPVIPRKPPAGEPPPLAVSNLSATLYAAGAQRLAGVPVDDPVWQEVLRFVDRCQNFMDKADGADARFDDGGFFFMPGDAGNNKAGPAGVDAQGRERYHSYGSMTADGVRAMLICGRGPDHPRVVAARHWLERHFSADMNPGTFAPDREVLREGTYYYYCWSVAHALDRLDLHSLNMPEGKVDWAEALSAALIERQAPDGSWSSRVSSGREDDPLVATPFAAATLLICRERMLNERPERIHGKRIID